MKYLVYLLFYVTVDDTFSLYLYNRHKNTKTVNAKGVASPGSYNFCVHRLRRVSTVPKFGTQVLSMVICKAVYRILGSAVDPGSIPGIPSLRVGPLMERR